MASEDSKSMQESFRQSYSETPTQAADAKVFASLQDLDKEQRNQVYEELGLWERGYTMGVLSYTFNILILLRFPEFYWCWHLIKAFIWLPWRFIRFRKRNMEWLMVDFCYVNTYLTVISCMVALLRITTGYVTPLHQYNYELIRGGFAFANGALLLSIPMFGNKLVFHEVDNTASMYIHLSPALLMWTLRWGGGYGTSHIENHWPNMFDVCHNMSDGDLAFQSWSHMLWDSGPCQGTFTEFLTYPSTCWILVWGIPYYLVIFVCARGYLERNNKATLFTYTVEDPEGNGRFILKLPEALQPLGYMLQHFLWSVTTGLLSIAMWNSFILHTLFLAAVVAFGIHNGSTFMFRVVAARHVMGKITQVSNSPAKRADYKIVQPEEKA